MDKFFRVPFATSGSQTAIPDDATLDGFVSYTDGYGPDYQRPKADPLSKNIERGKMNNLMFSITNAIRELQSLGMPDFITSALNGGTAYSYAADALARYNGQLYVSLANANTALPTDATKWTPFAETLKVVNAKNFGAKGDGVTDDTAAFLAAATAAGSGVLYAPAGNYVLDAMTFPSALKKFVGDGKGTILTAKASLTGAATTWLQFNFQNDLTVSDFALNISSTSHSTVVGVQFAQVTRGVIERIHVIDGGRMPIYVNQCSGMLIDKIQAENYAQSAVIVENNSNNVDITRVVATHAGTGNCIAILGGSNHKINTCYGGGAGSAFFTILLFGTTYSSVSNCIALGTTLEAIQITDGSYNSIRGNLVLCGVGHSDFGVSVFGDSADVKFNSVIDNIIINSGKSNVGVSANYLTTKSCLYTLVEGNHLISGNVLNAADGAGVYLLGGALCQATVVQNNYVVDEGNKIRYGVYESTLGGNPNNNRIIHNVCICGAVFISEALVVGTNSKVWDLEWQTFATTITALTGTITTVNTASSYLKYKRRGKSAEITSRAVITTNGTGAGNVVMTLPFAITNGGPVGRENGVSAKLCYGYDGGSNTMRIAFYDGTYPGANGAQINLTGIVEL